MRKKISMKMPSTSSSPGQNGASKGQRWGLVRLLGSLTGPWRNRVTRIRRLLIRYAFLYGFSREQFPSRHHPRYRLRGEGHCLHTSCHAEINSSRSTRGPCCYDSCLVDPYRKRGPASALFDGHFWATITPLWLSSVVSYPGGCIEVPWSKSPRPRALTYP